MKYIKLFESFNRINENDERIFTVLFDFLPFDDQVNNPMVSSIPESLNISGIKEFSSSNPGVDGVGLFIGHAKDPGGGFHQYVIKSTDPLMIDLKVFDKEFKKVHELDNIKAEDLGDVSRGTKMLGRFGAFGSEE